MNTTTIAEVPATAAPDQAATPEETTERMRRALDASGDAPPTPRGWIVRVHRTSPLETRHVTR